MFAIEHMLDWNLLIICIHSFRHRGILTHTATLCRQLLCKIGELLAECIKILVIDDSPDLRDLFICMLKDRGFQVLTAEDGLKGLEMAEVERPNLIITDIEMPNLDGIQLITCLREKSGFSEVPIWAVSARGGEILANALSAGATLALQKPLDFDSFINRINCLLPAGTA